MISACNSAFLVVVNVKGPNIVMMMASRVMTASRATANARKGCCPDDAWMGLVRLGKCAHKKIQTKGHVISVTKGQFRLKNLRRNL